MSTGIHKLVVFGIRESIFKTFGKYVSSTVLGFHIEQSQTRFRYLVPPMLCQPASSSSNYLSTSSHLAILDDLSSFAAMAGDSTHRTGVSLSLSAELLHPERIKAGDEIQVLCQVDKIGRSVGFLTIEFQDISGKVVARGTHNKFMPTGFLWETLLSKPLFPFGLWLFGKYAGQHKYRTPVDYLFQGNVSSEDAIRALKDIRPKSLTGAVGSVFDLFALTNAPATTATPSSEGLPVIHRYEMDVLKETKNYVGLMHGGAIAGAIEKACLLSRNIIPRESSQPTGLIVGSMSVRYLSANKGRIVVEVTDDDNAGTIIDPVTQQRMPLQSVGSVKDAKTGKVTVQFTCTWRALNAES